MVSFVPPTESVLFWFIDNSRDLLDQLNKIDDKSKFFTLDYLHFDVDRLAH